MIEWNPAKHIIIHTGDLIDRGPKIKEAVEFAMDPSNNMYTLMSNHEFKLLQYLRGRWPLRKSLVETIQQLGHLATKPYFVKWLESLPHIKWSDHSYVIHAGIIPDSPVEKQTKATCIYIRSWNPSTKKISNEKKDKRRYTFPLSYDDYSSSFKIYFGHVIHGNPYASDYVVALDGGAAFGGNLRACVNGKEIVQVKSKMAYAKRN